MKMTEETALKKTVDIPEGVDVTIEGNNTVQVKGEKGELSRSFPHPMVEIKKSDGVVEVNCRSSRRRDVAFAGTCAAHIANMIKGVKDGFEYRMKVVYSHFPIKTVVENNEFLIHNFLGERTPRRAVILDGVEVEVKGEDIFVRGINKENVGQTVANIEHATKVKNRDIRVFQDGIYRVSDGRSRR